MRWLYLASCRLGAIPIAMARWARICIQRGGYPGLPLVPLVNLRWEQGRTRAWSGFYTDPNLGHQARVGFDQTFTLAPAALMQVSLQAASQGFFGGSALLVLGDRWFVVARLGRTNLQPYFNLSFDPNDSITEGFGWKGRGDTSLALTVVADDRLGTGQKGWHVFSRTQWNANLRVSADFN
jgi:hypothetical protein